MEKQGRSTYTQTTSLSQNLIHSKTFSMPLISLIRTSHPGSSATYDLPPRLVLFPVCLGPVFDFLPKFGGLVDARDIVVLGDVDTSVDARPEGQLWIQDMDVDT